MNFQVINIISSTTHSSCTVSSNVIVTIKKILHKSFVFLIKLLLLFYRSLQQDIFFAAAAVSFHRTGNKICTYWLSGRAEQENIWLKIRMYGSRAKYFPVQSYLTQSIRISSYDWTLFFFLTERTGIDQFAFLAGLRFSSPIANDMYCTQNDFFICFSYKIAHGAIQVIL